MAQKSQSPLDQFLSSLNLSPVPGRQVSLRDSNTTFIADPKDIFSVGAGQQPSQTVGPLVDSFGRNTTVDVFLPSSPLYSVSRGSSPPFLYFSTKLSLGTPSAIPIHDGYFWILSSQFGTFDAVLGPSFFGLQVQSGTIKFSTPISHSPIPGSTVIDNSNIVTLSLTLEQKTSGNPTASPNSKVTVPSNVTFQFGPSGAKLQSAVAASLEAFGQQLCFSYTDSAPSLDPILGRINFPFTTPTASFAPDTDASKLVEITGKAPITVAAWSLPLNFTSPETLGLVSGAGGMALNLGSGLGAQPPGQFPSLECGPSVLLVEPGFVVLGGLTASATRGPEYLKLGSESSIWSRVSKSPFRYIQQIDKHESWACFSLTISVLCQPRTVQNQRTRISVPGLVLYSSDGTENTVMIDCEARNPTELRSYAIKNLLLKATEPERMVLVGKYKGRIIVNADVYLVSDLRYMLPFLPDPYTANLDLDVKRANGDQRLGQLQLLVKWTSDPTPHVHVTLPSGSLHTINPMRSTYAESTGMDVAATGKSFMGNGRHIDLSRWRQYGPVLLDLSTNVSQFGVCINYNVLSGEKLDPTVSDLLLEVPQTSLNLVTLPAVQWEAVNDPADADTLTFDDSGPKTLFAVDRVTLTPVAPRPAIDSLISAYSGIPSAQVSARFTLPFGMLGFAQLKRSLLWWQSPEVQQVQPSFSAPALTGGDQLSIRAGWDTIFRLPAVDPQESPSLPGYAAQASVSHSTKSTTLTSVLGPEISQSFNDEFFLSKGHSIPVTRIDISGFGESTFSDWRNPNALAGTVAKAEFHVFTGRTAKEVVKIFSVLFPFAVRIVRTRTIERLNDGTVMLQDSGWRPISNGAYGFGLSYPDITTHPGVVTSIDNVRNIRELDGVTQTIGGIVMQAVQYDCDMLLENVESGQGPNGVPALNQMGYLQLIAGPFNAVNYAQLLQKTGHLGGQVDSVINIGASGLRMRIFQIGVGATSDRSDPSTVPTFSMSAWGTVVFPLVGQWTFLQQPISQISPTAIDPKIGVPLIRQGLSTDLSITGPYRFSDPEDLLNAGAPSREYGILFSTGSQRVYFPRPKVETDGTPRIDSDVKPLIADLFSLISMPGPFPRAEDCVPFRNDQNYQLDIGNNGSLKLLPETPYQLDSVVMRTTVLSTNMTNIIYLGEADSHGVITTKSEILLNIDSEAAVPWTLNVSNTKSTSVSSSVGPLASIRGDIVSSAMTGFPSFQNSRLDFESGLASSKDMSALDVLGPMKDLQCTMSNEIQLNWGMDLGVDDILKKAHIPSRLKDLIEKFIDGISFKLKCTATLKKLSMTIGIELEIDFKFPVGPGYVIALIAGAISFSTQGTDGLIKLGAGYDWGGKMSGFTYKAEVVIYYEHAFHPDGFANGGGLRLAGEIAFCAFIKASLQLEATLMIRTIKCATSNDSCWLVSTAQVAIEVHVFTFLDIEYDVAYEDHTKQDGGGCPWT
ncbi:MAG: hypothetical protein M1839_003292 [Geoglossum umbratile]|nr:MAG: hypothetical protein M1839_003292 [Geoglossum umbratile]